MKEIKINYDFQEEDLININMYYANKNFKGYPLSIVFFVFWGYLSYILFSWNILNLQVHMIWIPTIILFFVWFKHLSIWKQISRNLIIISMKNMLKNKENRERILWVISFSLNKDNFTYEKDWTKNITPWENLSIEENENYIFLNKTTLGGYAIAKKKIIPEEKREEAIDFIKERFIDRK